MSTTQPQSDDQRTPQRRICNLGGCEKTGHPWEFQAGFCSTEHLHRGRGRAALAAIKYSHTHCFSCFSKLKDIEPPKPDWAFDAVTSGWTFNADEERIEMLVCDQETTSKAACGYQTLRPEATIDEKRTRTKTITGTVCDACGAADHTTHIALLADGHRTAVKAVAHCRDNDAVESLDIETLHRRYLETDDLERATGEAVELKD